MRDFDFDEIDRAVNSLNETAQTTDGNDNDTPMPDYNPGQTESSTRPSVPLAVKRSSGQFMDVVHPSSNMRRVPLVMPERGSVQRPANNEVPVIPAISVEPLENNSFAQTDEKRTWPDPIDFSGSNVDQPEKAEELDQDQFEDSDIDRISDDITNELSQNLNELSDSPFITGTKVEKRPLGAFSDDSIVAEVDEINESDEQVEIVDNLEYSVDTDPIKVNESLPDELQNDLLQVESDDIESITDNSVIKDNPIVDTQPVVISQPVATGSIVQQYKEQPSTGDQDTGAIYDTDAYHKSLASPTKKKSSWLWIIWILLLIVVGVGAGAAVYYYVLPLL